MILFFYCFSGLGEIFRASVSVIIWLNPSVLRIITQYGHHLAILGCIEIWYNSIAKTRIDFLNQVINFKNVHRHPF
jgi:hypothetical protein